MITAMSRTVRVTGKGILKVRPDLIRLIITLTGTEKEYSEALRRSTEDTDALKSAMEKLGFRKSDLKTLAFNVDTKYESYRDRNNDYKQRFTGYEFTHQLKLEFPLDNKLLGKTLYALAHSPVHPEFRIRYTVSDPEGAKNELLSKAVADAAAKAEVLTKAANVKLNDIQSIDYSWGEIDLDLKMMPKLMADGCDAPMCAEDAYDIDVDPDDIEVTDTVTVVWEMA